MNPEVYAEYIREEQAYYLKTGCPRTFAELVESFRRYYYAARRVDWVGVK
jgi:hypothetical protein